MKPIPLSAPDGTVYAYACGVCRHVRTLGEMLVRKTKRDVVKMANESKRSAEACCRCFDCDKPLKTTERLLCAACVVVQEKRNEEIAAAHEQKQKAHDDETRAKAKDFDAANLLCLEMREISEDTWCAGWMGSLEFILWEAMTSTEPDTADYELGVPRFDRDDLRRLVDKAGGWWIWDNGERFVTLEEWAPLWEAHQTRVHAATA
jgi:hypothetical protein